MTSETKALSISLGILALGVGGLWLANPHHPAHTLTSRSAGHAASSVSRSVPSSDSLTDNVPPSTLAVHVQQNARTLLRTNQIPYRRWTPARLNQAAIRRRWPGPVIPSVSTIQTILSHEHYPASTITAFWHQPNTIPVPTTLAHHTYQGYTLPTSLWQQAFTTAAAFVQAYWSDDPYDALRYWDNAALSKALPSQTLATAALANWYWRYHNPYSGILPTRAWVIHSWVTYATPLTATVQPSAQGAALYPMSGPAEQIVPFVVTVQPHLTVVQTLWWHHHWDLVEWQKTLTVQLAWIKNAPQTHQPFWQVVALHNHLTQPAQLIVLAPLPQISTTP